MRALLVGATGAVGKEVLRASLNSGAYQSITAVGRRPVNIDLTPYSTPLIQHTVDFENLGSDPLIFQGYDHVFCTLGTTRADAGSTERYIAIDQTYVLEIAKLTNPTHFFYCSSVGANPDSWFFYPRTKGQTEFKLKELTSKWSIFRPAFLKLTEPRDRTRSIDHYLANYILPIMDKLFGEARVSCGVDDVAKAMLKVALSTPPSPSKTYGNAEIIKLARTG